MALGVIGIRKVRRPKMTNRSGRTWDVCNVILRDGTQITGHLDTTWGRQFYFEQAGEWYAGQIDAFEQPGGEGSVMICDLRRRRIED